MCQILIFFDVKSARRGKHFRPDLRSPRIDMWTSFKINFDFFGMPLHKIFKAKARSTVMAFSPLGESNLVDPWYLF